MDHVGLRSFAASPPKWCVGRATPIEERLDTLRRRPEPHYTLGEAASAAACEQLPGCTAEGAPPFSPLGELSMPCAAARDYPRSAEISRDRSRLGELHVMHNGTGGAVVLAARPK